MRLGRAPDSPAQTSTTRPVRAYSAVAITPTTGVTDATGRKSPVPKSSSEARQWQERAYDYYDQVGEVNYAAQFYARMLTKLELYVGEINEEGLVDRSTDEQAIAAFADVQDPGGGRSKMLAAYGRLRFLVGECYLVATRSETPDEQWTWEILSTEEIQPISGRKGAYKRRLNPNDQGQTLVAVRDGEPAKAGDVVVYRLWKAHPRYSGEPDCSMRGVLDIVDELLLLTQAVRSRTRSRLASSGFILIPDSLTLDSAQDDPDADDEDPEADPIMQRIVDAAMQAIADETSASAVVPIILRGDAESLKEMRPLQVFDPKDTYPEQGLRRECVERFALGIDMPPEMLLGVEQSNHWTAWLVDDSTWKAHGRPVAEEFCDELSEVILKPRLRRAGYSEQDLQRFVIYYDASAIVNHPNRTRDAFGAHDRLVISDAALLEALGFPDGWAPTEAEWEKRKDLWVRPRLQSTAGGSPGAPSQASASPDALTHSRSLDRVCGAIELAVERAREQAGNRLLTRARRIPQLAAQLRGVPTRDIPGRIGSLGVATLGNGTPLMSTDLVAGATDPLAATLTRWGVPEAVIDHLCSRVESHAAQTLWDPQPAPLGQDIALLAEAAARAT